MMRSMFSGVSGLRVHQTKMDVIANNISNVNTVGFKSSRVTFAEIFAQTTAGASRANDTTGRGGTNPMQIGLGSTVASIDLSTTQGAAQRTDNPYDLMIQGSGFFIVGDQSGTYFTRAGAFNLDEAGNLVMPNGMKVMGWPREWDDQSAQYIIRRSMVEPFQITPVMRYAPPQQTSRVTFEDNLNAINYMPPGSTIMMSFYDSLGNRFTTEVTFRDPTNSGTETEWNWVFGDGDSLTPQMPLTAYLDGDLNKPFEFTPGTVSGTVTFNTFGDITGTSNPVGTTGRDAISTPVTFTIGNSQSVPPLAMPATNLNSGGGNNTIILDFFDLTQFGEQDTNVKAFPADGYGPGQLMNVSIGSDGIINGLYSNGEMQILGQIVVAQFRNPAGLEKFGDNLYIPTPNSGEFDGIGEPVQLSGGKIMGGVLEMSNVDLAAEFTEMITTQRGFQANSRIITVSDDMLAELVNLKR